MPARIARRALVTSAVWLLAAAVWSGAAGPPRPASEPGGYGLHWEVSLGQDLKAVLTSRGREGGILLTRADGSLIKRKDVGEITWVQLFDFDGDGQAEIVTEQVEGYGTGILIKSFSVYRASTTGLAQIWTGLSSSHKKLEEPAKSGASAFEEQRGFLRFDPPGGGRREATLLHLVEISRPGQAMRTEKHAFRFIDGSFQPIDGPR